MQRKALVSLVGGAAAVVAVGGIGTYLLAGTESTTALDHPTMEAKVNGHKALSGTIVGARTENKYHPLPWVGGDVSGVSCPDLKAVTGTKVTCTGKGEDGKKVSIPVSVVKASDSSVTWKFER
ncbi:hypothetical protein [Streptomyces sp. NBC_00286]|uniref:hypothetical protein n=1 Tax=Streptomyces sp. NBC_00286 TaxID=2975701 RepID=UPI002E2912B9|nr:hypothetical protein [Streptomyces sp. NBC_00286]